MQRREATSSAQSRDLLCCVVSAGIGFSNDKLLQTRVFSYSDTQRYRLGVNYQMLPINQPKCPFHNNHHDGHMNFMHRSEEVSWKHVGITLLAGNTQASVCYHAAMWHCFLCAALFASTVMQHGGHWQLVLGCTLCHCCRQQQGWSGGHTSVPLVHTAHPLFCQWEGG